MLDGRQRVLITAHDAFGYFGRRYGYRLFSLQGISTSSDFGLKDVTNLVDSIVSRKVQTIFPESSTPEEPLAAIQDGCKAKGQPLAIGQPLYADAMGQKGTAEGTYVGMFRYNFRQINQMKAKEAR
jgi:manganese/zinc/iron transport system substrate-binding protein